MIIMGISLLFGVGAFDHPAYAQTTDQGIIDYQGQPVLDKDLDGLTDLGEEQLFHTDPQKPDTDGDGILDGAEILGKTDPLDPNPPVSKPERSPQKETPWAWYIVRASGLIAFFLLFLSFFVGIAIRIPWLRRWLSWFQIGSFHCWVSLQALVFVLMHAGALLFDRYLKFTFKEIFIPFAAPQYTNLIAAGVIGMYAMLILVVSSYARTRIPHRLWRVLHSLNGMLYVLVFIHAMYLGTDLKQPVLRNMFWAGTILLVLLMMVHIGYRIKASRTHEV